MSEYYQELDAPHFDYQMQAIDGIAEHTFRGPIPDLSQPYIACIGGAQTMGRFVHRPFPDQLAEHLELPCLNLGLGGAGPRSALVPEVLGLLQRARLVVVQMFSGRSASNALFDNSKGGRNYGRCVRTEAWISFEDFFANIIARQDRALIERTVQETREDYAFYLKALGEVIGAPTVLLWLSQREPDYEPDWSRQFGILNHYPQLIDRQTVDAIRPAYSAYVECGKPHGLPQKLWHGDRVNGANRDQDGWLWNEYYPSPEMHDRATELLLPQCRQLLAQGPDARA